MPNNTLNHGRSKFISNYGGIGSLVETQDCSIIVETFDNWSYNQLNNKLSSYVIIDDRLLVRLKSRFPNLKHIVQIPTDKNTFFDHVQPTANHFPKWFYCPKCHRFKDYAEWKKRWNKDLALFNPPKCFNAECKGEILEQVRFVMVCKDGHIHDIPWKHWNVRLPSDISQFTNDEDENETDNDRTNGPQLDFTRICCAQQDLRYKVSFENTELSGIRIECNECKESSTLKGLFNLQTPCFGEKYWLGMLNGKFTNEACSRLAEVKVKTSNSTYYINTLSSIFIPEAQNPITNEIRIEIDNLLEDPDFSKAEIIKFISRSKKISEELIESYLDSGDNTYIPETIYRQTEYNYFLRGQQPEDNQLRFKLMDCSEVIHGVSHLVKLDKLKKITVQTSFTRQEPIDIDAILIDEQSAEYQYNVKKQSVSKNNFETRFLPGIESYGEGILFVLDNKMIESWESDSNVISRADIIKNHANNSDWLFHRIEGQKVSARKIMIHTLSHLIIRELEYVCGYPAASIQERLYVSDSMNGFLISAYDGTDGYLGGLSKLCNNLENLNEIIQSALERANDCSLDPICYGSDGQGVAQLNLAACHSCTLVPEITCELSNLFLDRKLLVDKDLGFFKNRLL